MIAAFADELEPQDDARRLRTAIDPATPLLPQMLRDADALLRKARTVVPDAAGLVLCDDRAHARAVGALIRTIAGEKLVVVVSDELARTRGSRSWPAGTRQPEMARGREHGQRRRRRATTPRRGLRDGQANRPVLPPGGRADREAPRRDPDDLLATVFMPADPTLKHCAERVEVELRQQVSDEIGAAFDIEPPPGLARRADFEALDADIQAGGMIIAGVHYRSEEVDAGRRLLRELDNQSARSARYSSSFDASAWRPARGVHPAALRPQPRRRRSPPIAGSRPNARRPPPRTPLGGAPPSDRPGLQLADGPITRQPRDGLDPRPEAGERQLDEGIAFLRQSWQN